MQKNKYSGFTIVELLIVVVVIGVLAALVLNSFSSAQARARDTSRITKLNAIKKAIEGYYAENGRYPEIQDAKMVETSCGSQTENWGHCDRAKQLADMLAPYISIEPTSLSQATQGNYYYHYTSQSSDNFQTYGVMVYLEGNGGQNDGGYYTNAYEAGQKPAYCMSKYTGTAANWTSYTAQCSGGN